MPFSHPVTKTLERWKKCFIQNSLESRKRLLHSVHIQRMETPGKGLANLKRKFVLYLFWTFSRGSDRDGFLINLSRLCFPEIHVNDRRTPEGNHANTDAEVLFLTLLVTTNHTQVLWDKQRQRWLNEEAPKPGEPAASGSQSLSAAAASSLLFTYRQLQTGRSDTLLPAWGSHVGTDLNFSYSGRCPIGTLRSRPLSEALSLDPTLLGVFHFISFKVWLQTLFLLNLHLSGIKVGEKYQKRKHPKK